VAVEYVSEYVPIPRRSAKRYVANTDIASPKHTPVVQSVADWSVIRILGKRASVQSREMAYC
jgi:hypothetical protein